MGGFCLTDHAPYLNLNRILGKMMYIKVCFFVYIFSNSEVSVAMVLLLDPRPLHSINYEQAQVRSVVEHVYALKEYFLV